MQAGYKNILIKAIRDFDLESYISINCNNVDRSHYPEIRLNCISPNCSDNKQHLYVNVNKKNWYCQKCQYGSKQHPNSTSLYHFIADNEGISYKQATDKIISQSGTIPTSIDDILKSLKKEEPVNLISAMELPSYFEKLSRFPKTKVYRYALARGLTKEWIKSFDLLICINPKDYIWFNRVIFPLYNLKNELISIAGRDITGERNKKWIFPLNSQHNNVIWPTILFIKNKPFSLSKLKNETAFIVEGIFDAIGCLRQDQFALCTFGKNISRTQINNLQSYKVKEFIFAWDQNAMREMLHTAEALQNRLGNVSLFPYKDETWIEKDLGNLIEDTELVDIFLEERENRVPVNSYEFFSLLIRNKLDI